MAPLPNLIIAGVNKAGTTSLFSYLALHPEICASSIKETCYFLPLRYGKELSPLEQYYRYFSHWAGQQYILESTPGYFYGGAFLAQTIQRYLGKIKIILIFREPISRLVSFYKFKKSRLELPPALTLEQYIRKCQRLPAAERRKQENNVYWGIEGGLYANYLPDWFDTFGEEVKVLFFDQLQKNPRQLLRNLSDWLQINPAFFDNALLSVENRTTNYRSKALQWLALFINHRGEKFWRTNPRLKRFLRQIYYQLNGASFQEVLSEETRAALETIFQPYNQQLALQLIKYGYDNLPDWCENSVLGKNL